MAFKKATKLESKLRLSLAGPAGSGKTWTALMLATALADGGSVAVIDTERGSASKYADQFSFDVSELTSFSPEVFVSAIHEAEAAGYAVLVIDSISHEWNGHGGVLDIVDQAAKRMKTANTFSAWGEGTPKHNSFIDAILCCKMHVICTMRSKEEYVQERSGDRAVIRKVGMAPIQRDGIQYEFDIAAELDYEHTLIVQKSRCPALSGAVISKPDTGVAETLKAWLHGEAVPAPQLPAATIVETAQSNGHPSQEQPPVTEQQLASLRKLYSHLGTVEPDDLERLTYEAARERILELSRAYNEQRQKKPSPLAVPSDVPAIDALKALCEEIMGPGKWKNVRAYVLDLTKLGDIPDEVLDEPAHTEDRRKLHKALLAKQQAKAQPVPAGKEAA